MDETLEQCAIRELEEETGLRLKECHQIGTYSGVTRDPRGRTVSVIFTANVDPAKVHPRGGDDAKEARWFPLSAIPQLAFDHGEVLAKCIQFASRS